MWSGAQLEGSNHCERRIGNWLSQVGRSGIARAHCTKIKHHTTRIPKLPQSDSGPSELLSTTRRSESPTHQLPETDKAQHTPITLGGNPGRRSKARMAHVGEVSTMGSTKAGRMQREKKTDDDDATSVTTQQSR